MVTMGKSDSSLLSEYIAKASSRSFEQLVERYQNLVYSAALRRTGDSGMAEEVAQDVFIFLSKQARLLVRHGNLAGWLYQTTLKKAANRMKSEKRRKLREESFAEDMITANTHQEIPSAAFVLVDEALSEMPAKDREALVLRYFQDLDLKSVGEVQGTNADAARKRVTRALEKLHTIFRRKGVAIPTSTAVVTVLTGSIQPAPASLLMTATASAVAPAVPSMTSLLTNAIITMSKTKIIAASVVVLAIPFAIQQTKRLSKESRSSQNIAVNESATNSEGNIIDANNTTSPLASAKISERPVTGATSAPSSIDLPVTSEPEEMNQAMLFIRDQINARHAGVLAELVSNLDLDDTQKAHVEAVLKNRGNAILDFMVKNEGDGDFPQTLDEVKELGGLIRGEGLRESIAGILSDRQLKEYDAYKEEKRSRLVEGLAYKEFAKIAPAMNLSPEQKDKIFGEIYDTVSVDLDEEQDYRAMMSLFSGGSEPTSDMMNVKLAKALMKAEADGTMGTDQFIKDIELLESQRIEEKLSRVKSILNQQQLEQYRAYLETTGLHFMTTPKADE